MYLTESFYLISKLDRCTITRSLKDFWPVLEEQHYCHEVTQKIRYVTIGEKLPVD